ncbi:hypothetical protein [Agrobacterium sp. AGB01]|uniref:hypothetical protein n=1 Tax=Agrobacterium sp. AGB01 TaxID=2769302 RepID=UPI00353006B0
MLDKQQEERIEMDKKVKASITSTDRILATCGVTLAAAAAFFPWYVFFNEDKFGVTTPNFDMTRDLPHTGPKEVFSVSPLAMVNRNKDDRPDIPPLPFDPLTTATVSDSGKERQNNIAAREEQPFPGHGSNYRLLHVANGRALIEDSAGMYMVKVGSVLPDNTKLAKIEQRDGRWVIVTSNGEIYENESH